ncbi:MAG: 6,7-dimethyl-8-ribityllumazine synthase [Proteobacteria bacterium]|nr:6,7-dimethyl-8-ribityllumazine synthase [Pseudomonadota bacterium]
MSDDPYLLIIDSRFYEDIADELVKGAIAAIEANQASYTRVSVPGAFELAAAVRFAVRSMELVGGRRRYDGYVVLGCVIRGETDHYEHISRESIRAVSYITVEYSLALGLGILTCDTREQAISRAAINQGNKGGAAAEAALHMIRVKRSFVPPR